MKKLMTALLGLAFLTSTVAVAQVANPPAAEKKTEKKAKKTESTEKSEGKAEKKAEKSKGKKKTSKTEETK